MLGARGTRLPCRGHPESRSSERSRPDCCHVQVGTNPRPHGNRQNRAWPTVRDQQGVISLCRLITKPGETPGCMLAKPPAPCAGPGTASLLLPHYLQCPAPGTQRGQQNVCILPGGPNDGTQETKDDTATVVARGDAEVTTIPPGTERSEQPLQGSPYGSQLLHSEADAPASPLSQQKEKTHCPPLRETLAKPD